MDYIDAEIAEIENYQRKGYKIILTGHYVPEGQKAFAEKLNYLQKVEELAQTCKSKEEFIAAVKKAFPNYQGENYLEMSAGALFQ